LKACKIINHSFFTCVTTDKAYKQRVRLIYIQNITL